MEEMKKEKEEINRSTLTIIIVNRGWRIFGRALGNVWELYN